MAIQFSTRLRNARADVVESTVGASPIMQIRTGPPPADCGAPDSGDVLATLVLPADWLTDATGGAKALAGLWEDLSADDSGTPGHFRVCPPGSPSECDIQGTVGLAGSPTYDMVVDSIDWTAGEGFQITEFGWTEGQA